MAHAQAVTSCRCATRDPASRSASARGGSAALLALQCQAGNAAVSKLVQRDVVIAPPDPDLNTPIPGGTDDEGTFCKPYATKAKALRRRDELMVNAVRPLTAVFG